MMAMIDPRREESPATDARARLTLAAAAAIAGTLAAIVFVGWPSLDLELSRLLNLGPRQFWLNGSDVADELRALFTLLTWVASLAAVAGVVLALASRWHLFGLGLPQWLFLVSVLALGPGLLANVVLKDHWARPRPMHIVEFGGPDQFTPVLARTGTCQRNCSFVSGEASAAFAFGFAIALLARRRRALFMGAALLAGGVIGFIRMGEGGHFLSDIVFAGVFMGLVVALLHWLVFAILPRLGDEAEWHARTVAGARWLNREAARLGAAASDWTRRHVAPVLPQRFRAPREDDREQ